VDDILIVYNCEHTIINTTRSEFNNLHRKVQFITENESNNKVNLLDFTIKRTHEHLQFGIYTEPTATDILINGNSCHPIEHKMSGVKTAEVETIEHMLKVNNYCYQKQHDQIKRVQRRPMPPIKQDTNNKK
jgi:hypothetical protein